MSEERSAVDDVRAILVPHESKFASAAAAEQFAELAARKLGSASPSVLPGAVEFMIGQPEFSHYFRQDAPVPGSLAWAKERTKAEAIARANAPRQAAQDAIERRREAVEFWQSLNSMSPEERSRALGEAVHAARDAGQTKLRLKPKT